MKTREQEAHYYSKLLLDPEEPMHWVRDIVLLVENGIVQECMPYKQYKKQKAVTELYIHEGYFVPALVNAHTHLDINYMAEKTTHSQGFVPWLRSVLQERSSHITDMLTEALATMPEVGYVATISNTMTLSSILQEHNIAHTMFYECIGSVFEENTCIESPYNARHSLAGHAVYSTSADVLSKAKAQTKLHNMAFSIHLAEHEEEQEFMFSTKGEFAVLLQKRLVPKTYIPPKKTPVAYACELGILDTKTLAIHCVHVSEQDIQILQDTGVTVCVCPRSNAYIGVGTPPVARMLEKGIPVCLGTDSLASNHDLSLWNEAEYLLDTFAIAPHTVLKMMTTTPAKILQIDNIFGHIKHGSSAHIVELPMRFEELYKK